MIMEMILCKGDILSSELANIFGGDSIVTEPIKVECKSDGIVYIDPSTGDVDVAVEVF